MSPETAADPASIRASLEELDRSAPLADHGSERARRRAALFDGILTELFERAGAPAGVALVAVGGYGRAQMLPRSDLDLLLLHAPDVDPAAVADAVLYPLWDAGVEVGHGVRTHEECLALCEGDVDALTAMLDARPVVGDGDMAARTIATVRGAVAADVAAFAATLRRDRDARATRSGSAAHELEPDLKQGLGGLRDAHILRWLAAAIGRPLEEAGVLRPAERRAADEAEELLVRVRSAVQLLTGRRQERLAADVQAEIAAAVGFQDAPGWTAPDRLMRTLFEGARDVDHVVSLALERAAGSPGVDGSTPGDPAAALAALADVAEAGTAPSPRLLDAVEAAIPTDVAWDGATRDAFFRLLRAGAAGIGMLEVLDRMGLLVRYLPAWEDVRCRPQRDPYHRLTVDAHLLSAVTAARDLLHDEEPPFELPPSEDHDACLLGALLHDIGKVGRADHVRVGANVAAGLLDRIGVDGPTRELVAFMVAEHLLLPDTATRRDLSDEDLIMDVAARVGSSARLAALGLLAEADARATGPAAATPWRRALVAELVSKVGKVLERGEMGEALAVRLATRVERVRELLADEQGDDVDRFVLRMPRRYFLAVEPARIAQHFGVIAPPLGTGEVRVWSAEGARPGSHELLVVAGDRRGLLSWIAGALTLERRSILAAQAFTTEDGVAVDLFEVEGTSDPDPEAERGRIAATLRGALGGSVSIERLVEARRAHYPQPRLAVPVTVRVDEEASDFSTVIEVGAADRIGLLHDITRTLAELHVDVHVAKIATYDGRVVDSFYVRDPLGRKIVERDVLDEIAAALRAQLGA